VVDRSQQPGTLDGSRPGGIVTGVAPAGSVKK